MFAASSMMAVSVDDSPLIQARIRRRHAKKGSTWPFSTSPSRPQSQCMSGLPWRGHERSDTQFTLDEIKPLNPLNPERLMQLASSSSFLDLEPEGTSTDAHSTKKANRHSRTSRISYTSWKTAFTSPRSRSASPSRDLPPLPVPLPYRPDSKLIPDLTNELEDVTFFLQTNNTIYKGRLKSSNKDVAIKVSRPKGALSDDDLPAEKSIRLMREEEVVRACQGLSSIVPILGWAIVGGSWGLVSPWFENGNAKEYVKKNPDVNRRAIVLQVAEALTYLHNLPIPVIHADLKAENVLINAKGEAVLHDFGCSKLLAERPTGLTTPNVGQGTLRWMAPEVLAGEPCTTKADVYSFGIFVLELMTGQLPFFKLSAESAVVIAVSKGQVPNRKSYPELHEEDPFWPLLNRCWSTEPEDRPDMKELYETLRQWQSMFSWRRPKRAGPKANA